jgi:hypothetical protein
MNGKQSKRIRQEVYGDDYSPKFREYRNENRRHDIYAGVWNQYGTITAGPRRQAYQKMKKESQRRQ